MASFFSAAYTTLKVQNPQEGRRRRKLRCVQSFWDLPSTERPRISPAVSNDDTLWGNVDEGDADPLDACTGGPELALLVRTDFSKDGAWNRFLANLKEAEKEIIAQPTAASQPADDVQVVEPSTSANSQTGPDQKDGREDAGMDDEDSEEDEDDNSNPPSIVAIIDPPLSALADRTLLTNISNLTALRLFNDVSVAPAPPLPPSPSGWGTDTKRIKPGNRLIDLDKYVEVYEGKRVWVYDGKSNVDGSARLISGSPNIYGTATADSWRARAAHIPELEVNLFTGTMKIDFGGLDRWDHEERRRSMIEVQQPLS